MNEMQVIIARSANFCSGVVLLGDRVMVGVGYTGWQ